MPEANYQVGRELTDGELEDLAKACEDSAKISIENHCAGDYLHNLEIAESLRKYAALRKDHAAKLEENAKLKVLVADLAWVFSNKEYTMTQAYAEALGKLILAGYVKTVAQKRKEESHGRAE